LNVLIYFVIESC